MYSLRAETQSIVVICYQLYLNKYVPVILQEHAISLGKVYSSKWKKKLKHFSHHAKRKEALRSSARYRSIKIRANKNKQQKVMKPLRAVRLWRKTASNKSLQTEKYLEIESDKFCCLPRKSFWSDSQCFCHFVKVFLFLRVEMVFWGDFWENCYSQGESGVKVTAKFKIDNFALSFLFYLYFIAKHFQLHL